MDQTFEPWMVVPARASRPVKARWLLCHGRVVLEAVYGNWVKARVRGEHDTYMVSWTNDAGWDCTCPAIKGCSHLDAVRLVVDRSELGRHRSNHAA